MSSSSEARDADSDHSGGDGTGAGSFDSASRVVRTGEADSGYRGRGGSGRGAGRGTGRQRNGKNWKVIGCPTAIRGTLPQLPEEDVNGGSIQGGDNSIIPVPSTTSENKVVHLEAEFHTDGRYLLKMCNNYGLIYGGAPDPARWLCKQFYDTNFKAIYRSWSELPTEVIKEWFYEFEIKYCCPDQSDDVFFEAFKHMVSLRYKDIINKMRKKWIEKKIRPVCMIGKVWDDWLAWWDSPEFKKLSNKNKRNRESENGEACVHTGGSLSLINLLDRMKKIHGKDVDEMDALIAMHTRTGPDGRLIWATKKHEKVFRQYKDIVRERAIKEGIIEPNTPVPFDAKDWEDAVVADQGRRVPTGKKLFGFGPAGRPLLNLPTSRTHASSICQATVQNSFKSIRELKLESDMDGLKEMMKQMMEEREKDRKDRELEKERERQEREQQNQLLMGLLMNSQQQMVPWSTQQQQQNQWPPGLMLGASGSYQQQPPQNQQQSPQNQWPFPMFQPQQQLSQLVQQPVQQPYSDQGLAAANSNGRASSGSEGGGGSGGGNAYGNGIFAGGVGNTSMLGMLMDPIYSRSGNEGV